MNVGGTGKLAMSRLASICQQAEFDNVKTYIQSGNVVFNSSLARSATHARLSAALTKELGRPAGVVLRTAAELKAIVDGNPFPDAPASQLAILFLPEPPVASDLQSIASPDGELVHLGAHDVYIHYVRGMGHSKLKLPAAWKNGTARNLNTVRKLLAMAIT